MEQSQAAVQQLQNELDGIRLSPGWRLLERYRGLLNAGRRRHPRTARVVDAAARRLLLLASRAPTPPEPSPTPQDGFAASPATTAVRPAVTEKLSGKCVACPDPEYEGKVFHVIDGQRHWVPSPEHMQLYGFRFEDVVVLSRDEMARYDVAAPLPMPWSDSDWENPSGTNPMVMREIATSRLRGYGIEFGAGTNPTPVPAHCRVDFADFMVENELVKRAYTGQNGGFVRLKYRTRIEEASGILDGSLDFAIACHVIEHVRNPLLAMRRMHELLKPGGQFVLIVPDMRLTFDKNRDLTTLEHLILDYEKPSLERDTLHYVEFFSRAEAFVTPIEGLYQRVQDAIANDYDAHFHTWTFESFREFVEYARRTSSPWSEVWAQPAANHPDANEFYYVLTK